MMTSLKHLAAFTLAELLVVMAVLGVISTFTIPKIMHTIEVARSRPVLKDNVALISQILYEALQNNVNITVLGNYFISRLNGAKMCTSDALTQGCISGSITGAQPYEEHEPGVLLNDGSAIVGLNNDLSGTNGFILITRKDAGNYKLGENALYISICYNNSSGNCNAGQWFENQAKPGVVSYMHVSWVYSDFAGYYLPNKQLFLSLF
jgi:prepilin-type N-terminal cleavage/methylation domain-containing protein